MVNSAVELAIHDPEIAAIVKSNRQEVETFSAKPLKKGKSPVSSPVVSTQDRSPVSSTPTCPGSALPPNPARSQNIRRYHQSIPVRLITRPGK